MKVCSKCKVEKELSEFSKCNKVKDGLSSRCKSCDKKYRENNIIQIKEKAKKWRHQNKNNKKEYDKIYREKNKEIILNKKKIYHYSNKDKINKNQKIYYQNNKEYLNKKSNEWINKNKDYYKKYKNIYCKQKRENDILYKFKNNVRCNISQSFKRSKNKFKKYEKTETILGCTIEEFRLHIEKQFTEGMTIDNHGKWHLDHIIPISLATTQEEAIKLNHFTNFQPLWAADNIIKSNKIITDVV